MKRVHALAVLVLLCVPVAAADAQTVTLRYRWTKGESRSYRMTTQTDSTITGMPSQAGAPSGPLATSQTVTQVFNFTADEVGPDGSVTLRQTFQSVRMESTGPMGKVVVDSTVAERGNGSRGAGHAQGAGRHGGRVRRDRDGARRHGAEHRRRDDVSPTRSRRWPPPIPPRVRPPRPSEAS